MAEKHGVGGEKVLLDETLIYSPDKSKDLVSLDEALNRLEKMSPRRSRVVELRFFGGLEMEEIAKIEGVSVRTVKQDWSLARAWLHPGIAKEE
jgi:RNA polymerase sigma-70 factor (ECF subfamily)